MSRRFIIVYFPINKNTVGITYSPILRDIETTALGYEMISHINWFLHDPENQYRVLLNENDLLIMDNCRVLHGRTAFDKNDGRLLLRFWNGVFSV